MLILSHEDVMASFLILIKDRQYRKNRMPLDFLTVINNSAKDEGGWRLTDFIKLKRNKSEGGNQLIRRQPSKISSSRNK